jgi:hypothetical protein
MKCPKCGTPLLNQAKPSLIGRTLRVLAGLYFCYWAFAVLEPPIELGELVGAILLGLLALSLILGGLTANPGCEVTALPNVILKKKWNFL